MQLADEMLRHRSPWLHGGLDEGHGLFDVGDFAEVIARAGTTLQRAFHIVRQGGVVALNAGRTQALQHVKNALELKKHRRRCGARQLQAAQMLQLGQHIHQRGVKGGVQQRQIKVIKFSHGHPASLPKGKRFCSLRRKFV